MTFNRRLRAALATLLLLFAVSVPAYAVLDGAVCSTADPGGAGCNLTQLKASINEEDQGLDDRAPMVLNSVAGTNDYTASVTPTLTAMTTGQTFWFKPSNTNTTAVRVNINSIGLTATVRADGGALGMGEMLSTNWYPLFYNGTQLRCTVCFGGAVLAEQFMMLNANYTLTSTVAEQKLFNSTANGRLTLEAGTYEFEAMLSLTTMSATSGNGAFDILGAGSATLGTVLYDVSGVDGAVSTAAAGSTTTVIAGQSPASMVTAAVGTEMQANIRGVFRVSVGGTIVPSITLVTAAAAVVRNGSYFKVKRIGAATVTNVGQWD